MHHHGRDDRPPAVWRLLDTIKIASLHSDIQVIAAHRDWQEFLIRLRDAEQQEFSDAGTYTDAQSAHWACRSEVEELARQIFPGERQAAADACRYMEHRSRFLFKHRFVKREADGIRTELAKPKARSA